MMNKYFLVLLSIVVFSCKSKQLKDLPAVVVYKVDEPIEDDGETVDNKSFLYYDITDKRGNGLKAVASKLVADEDFCYNAYSGLNGFTQLNYDHTKITKDSYLEIVYKGFSKEKIPFARLEKGKLQVIQLKRGDSIVTKEAYEKFYEEIRKCSW